jgi:CubicO group peptidase (beta-lactamase class C family)
MASIILFNNKNYGGVSQRFDGPTASLGALSKIASALIVCDGAWKLYSEPNYQGTVWTACSTGGPEQNGLYPLYDPEFFQNDTIQSLQPITYQDGGIILFQNKSFGGESVRLFTATADLATVATFSTQSAIICEGEWTLYAATNYQTPEEQVLATSSPSSGNATGLYPQLSVVPKSVKQNQPSPTWSATYSAIYGEGGTDPAMGYVWAAQQVDGEIISGVSGLARSPIDSPPDGLAFTADTRLNIASVSKEVTAVAILALINDGLIHALDDPMLPYIAPALVPYLTGPLPDGVASITIRDLLTMCSGLQPNQDLDPKPGQNIWGYLADHLMKGIQQGSVIGVTYNYSNADFTTLQGIIAACSGVKYVEYVITNVLTLLGVDTTIFNATPDPAATAALSYAGANDTGHGYLWPPMQFVAAGGWITSANQLVVFLSGVRRMLSSSGMFDDLLGFYVHDGTYGQYFHHNGGLTWNGQALASGGVHFSSGWDASFITNSPDNYSPHAVAIPAMIAAFEATPVSAPPAVASGAPHISFK